MIGQELLPDPGMIRNSLPHRWRRTPFFIDESAHERGRLQRPVYTTIIFKK